MGRFNLVSQHPKKGKAINGTLCMNASGQAQFFDGDGGEHSSIVAQLERARIEHASSEGILLSGVENMGGGKLRFQEWWLVFVDGDFSSARTTLS